MDYMVEKELNLTNFEYKDFIYSFEEDDIVLLGSPVYGVRVPKSAKNRFNGLKGNNTKIDLKLKINYGIIQQGEIK